MATLHRAFLLEADNFSKKINPILVDLDKGNAQPLFNEAVTIVKKTKPSEWLFRLTGENLTDIRQAESNGNPGTEPVEDRLKESSKIPSAKIGYWLLIVLSDFVKKRCPGMGYNYYVLERVLEILGWSQQDRKMLFYGTPTSLLLKPDLPTVAIPKREDPYWHWMIPRAPGRGWLSQKQIAYLHNKLLKDKKNIQGFDQARFGDRWGQISITIPEGQLEYLQRLQAAFGRAMMMLETAQQEQTDLFMVITYE